MKRPPINDLWTNTLAQIPSTLGKLQYLASLRDPNSGDYAHHGLASRCSETEACAVIRESHERVLEQWLMLGVLERRDDYVLYASGLLQGPVTIARSWMNTQYYLLLVPEHCSPAQREHYLLCMDELLKPFLQPKAYA